MLDADAPYVRLADVTTQQSLVIGIRIREPCIGRSRTMNPAERATRSLRVRLRGIPRA